MASQMTSLKSLTSTAAGTERLVIVEAPGGKHLRRCLIITGMAILGVPFAYLLLCLMRTKLFLGQLNSSPVTANHEAAAGAGTGPGSGDVAWRLASAAMMSGQLMYLCPNFLSPALRHPFISRQLERLARLVDRHRTLTFDEYEGGGRRMSRRSAAYQEIKAYLSATCAGDARHLRAESASHDAATGDKLVLTMLDGQEVAHELGGATVWWRARDEPPPRIDRDGGGAGQEKRRQLVVRYHERHHEFVNDTYLPRIRQQGRDLMVKNRQRKLFTNIATHGWTTDGLYTSSPWSHVVFDHPKTFATLAMDPKEKNKIVDDLDAYVNGKEHYARVGKVWKRGYLLYGPPGTGKSSMIAAMANHLDYDIYDIELTSVGSNAELRKMIIDTTPKSIIVFEDIDCSVDLTGARKKKKKPAAGSDGASTSGTAKEDTRMTLSGLLNAIDGLWSCCGAERIFVFTTNHVEKLDPALIRTGRMDMHILMNYCCFEAFKSLAKMYLDVDAHPLFDAVEELLREVEMTTADVAEHLTPKRTEDNNPDSCLAALVEALEAAAAKKMANGGNDNHDAQDVDQ